MRPDSALFLYLFLLLGGVVTLWAIQAFGRRRFRPGPAEDRVFRCSRCGGVYTDDPDVDLSRCPQCGLMNERFDFRS